MVGSGVSLVKIPISVVETNRFRGEEFLERPGSRHPSIVLESGRYGPIGEDHDSKS